MKRPIFPIILFLGTFLPTSINGGISSLLGAINMLIFFFILIYLLWTQKKYDLQSIILFLISHIFLLFSTLISPFSEKAFGALIGYLALTLLFCVDLRGANTRINLKKVFSIFNLIVISIGILIVFKNELIQSFISGFYAAYYDELVPRMLYLSKPIITFSTHSLAGLFLLLFFYLNFKTYTTNKSYLSLFYSFLYIFLMYNLSSNSGYLALLIATAIVLFYFVRRKPRKTIAAIVIALFIMLPFKNSTFTIVNTAYERVVAITTSENNGILGRFGESGNLRNNLIYITEHPFQPIGYGYSSDLKYGDSGLVEYTLRGSIFLALVIYYSFFTFLRKNLVSKKSAFMIFFIFIVFDFTVFSALKYFRTLYLLPFIVVYLNALESNNQKVTQ